jgi:hypothetical protein
MNKFVAHNYPFKAIFILITAFFLSSLYFSQENLPDFKSYEAIFNSVGDNNITPSSWEPIFMMLNYVFREGFNLSYIEFRLVLLTLSLSCLLSGLYLIQRNSTQNRDFILKGYAMSKLLLDFIILSAILVFLFEFYIIRVRSGLAISLFVLSIPFFYGIRDRLRGVSFFFAILLWLLAFFIHQQTIIILTYLLLLPMVFALYLVRSRVHRLWISSPVIKGIAFLFLSILIIGVVVINSADRGAHLYSSLNPVRMIALSIIPLSIVFIYWIKSRCFDFNIKKLLNMYGIRRQHSLGGLYPISHYFMSYIYIYLVIGLLTFYLLGILDGSGEAIVRLFTLSSVVAIVILLQAASFNRVLWSALLISNSAFFVNTIFG